MFGIKKSDPLIEELIKERQEVSIYTQLLMLGGGQKLYSKGEDEGWNKMATIVSEKAILFTNP